MFRRFFHFVSSAHVSPLFLYTLRILRAFSRFVLHFSLCFCIIQIRNPEHLIVYLTLSTPQRKNKHSTYNNMKEGDFLMKYGHFDDVHQEYVITTPKTPLPWINYLGCNEFFSLISNTCGGYTFYKDAKLLRLTRYRYNNVPADINGKYLTGTPYGTLAGSPRRPSWILTSAVTVSVTADSPLPRTVSRLPCSPSFL